uniref:Uncharacterized protein n=1 Tax=Anguilla anguilla TaxID=7936 RepID=A0A0E9WS66_ANGAN
MALCVPMCPCLQTPCVAILLLSRTFTFGEKGLAPASSIRCPRSFVHSRLARPRKERISRSFLGLSSLDPKGDGQASFPMATAHGGSQIGL